MLYKAEDFSLPYGFDCFPVQIRRVEMFDLLEGGKISVLVWGKKFKVDYHAREVCLYWDEELPRVNNFEDQLLVDQ